MQHGLLAALAGLPAGLAFVLAGRQPPSPAPVASGVLPRRAAGLALAGTVGRDESS